MFIPLIDEPRTDQLYPNLEILKLKYKKTPFGVFVDNAYD